MLPAPDFGEKNTAVELAVFPETRRVECSRFRWPIYGRSSAVVFAGARSHSAFPVPAANVRQLNIGRFRGG